MGRQPIPQPCQAAGVEGALVIETAEHESRGGEEKELESAGRNFVGARFPLSAAVATADVTQKIWPRLCFRLPQGNTWDNSLLQCPFDGPGCI